MKRNLEGQVLKLHQAVEIYKLRNGHLSQTVVGQRYGVHQTTVGDIWRGKYWHAAIAQAIEEEAQEAQASKG